MYVHVKDVYNLIKTRVYTSHKKNIAWKTCMLFNVWKYNIPIPTNYSLGVPPSTSIKNGTPYNIPP